MATKNDFKKSENIVYKEFFYNKELPGTIEKTIWQGKTSDNSFSFSVENGNKCETLIKIFGLSNPELFREKYNQAINGDGQEEKRINVLHSSSLAALLFFYAIDEQNPLTLEIDGVCYTFSKSYFEVKTIVCGQHKSNMDVVLEGKDDKGKTVLLFLESKFSEYLNSGKYTGISMEVYKKIYNKLGLFNQKTLAPILAKEKRDKDGKPIIELESSKYYHYCGGIKQMISHYMGVSNYAKRGDEALEKDSPLCGKTADVVLLGEILFKFDDNVDDKGRSNIYAADYKKLAKVINKVNEENKDDEDGEKPEFRMLEDVLYYQDIDNTALDEKVKSFYSISD